MKSLKYAVLFLALLAAFDGSAKARKTKTAKAAAAEAVKLDTPVDTFSYAMGIANTTGLKNYIAMSMRVDTTYMDSFVEGFQSQMPEAEQRRLQAYVAGMQIAQQVQQQIIPGINKQMADADPTLSLNETLFLQGFVEILKGQPTQIPAASANELVQERMAYYHETAMERQHGENRRAGEEFLKANAMKEGVQTLPGGVQYKVLTMGKGEIPTATSKVKVNYEGRLVDGTVFDSSYERNQPASFGCNQVIKGWTDALTHMPVGSKWEIYIPQELGYGAREAGRIPPYSALVFVVELLEIEQ